MATVEHELPQELVDMIPKAKYELSEENLATLAQDLVKIRDDAVMFRKSDGMEETWTACDEMYNGIDDLNRNEYKSGKWIKPLVMNAPVTTAGSAATTGRSTAFVRLTSRYVDAADAKVGEILIPIDGKAFSFTATPNPDLIKGKEDESQATGEDGALLFRDPLPGESPAAPMPPGAPVPLAGAPPIPPAAPGAPMPLSPEAPQPGVATAPPAKMPLLTKDLALEAITRANDKAKKAERRIFDWLTECQYPREMRKVIHDAARIGVGVLKGPYPDSTRQMAFINGKIEIHDSIVPVVGWRDPRNIFPDPGCGENIQDGDYVWERDFASSKQVRKMKKLKGYRADVIDLILAEGPGKKTTEGRNPSDTDERIKHQYEIWYFTGTIKRDQLEQLNAKSTKNVPREAADVHAIVTMINDRIVRATLSPLEKSGDLPYLSIPWQRRSGSWAGVGVAEQIQVPQRIVNASTRAMLNNAGVSSGAQIIIDQVAVKPADGTWIITPNKVWYKSVDGLMDDVRKAFATFNIENRVDELMKIIEYGMRLAEESTSIPLITQGQSGKTTPDTYGAAQLQDNNANQLLRRIGYTFDDHITERLIRMMYEWLLLDEDVPDEEKGDWAIHARGSTAMVERSIQDQTIGQMTTIAENPIFGVDPKRWFAQLMKSKKLDPADFQYSAEEQQKMDSAPKEPPIAVQVATIKAEMEKGKLQFAQQQAQADAAIEKELADIMNQTKLTVEDMRNKTAILKVKMDTDRDTIYVRAQTEKIKADYDGKMKELDLKRELMTMQVAADHEITTGQAKVKLADTAMKLKVQKELASTDMAVNLHKDTQKNKLSKTSAMPSPVEIPGRAKNGKAFIQ